MAFRAQGQGHLQGQMSKLYQKYISRVQLYAFKDFISILRSRFVFCTICLHIFLQYLNQKGGHHWLPWIHTGEHKEDFWFKDCRHCQK